MADGEVEENRARTLLRGVHTAGLGLIYYDDSLKVRMVENLPASWPPAETIISRGVAVAFGPFNAERILAAKREALAGGALQRVEAPLRADDGELEWFEITFQPDVDDAAGAPRGLFATVMDITQAKRREAALRDLLLEVSHRSRNMLAILQSILGQTAARAANVAEFEEKFRGRIASIAQSQDLITFANWQSVRFRRLAETQLDAFAAESGVTPQVEGLDPLLSPNATLHLGLALHELASNSAAFGVLGAGAGTLRLLATSLPHGCRFEWIELSAQPIAPPGDDAWGFGRTVLQNVVPRALRAEAVYSIDTDGVHYALDLIDPGEEAREGRRTETAGRQYQA